MPKKLDRDTRYCTYIDLPYPQAESLKKLLNPENPEKVVIHYISVIWEKEKGQRKMKIIVCKNCNRTTFGKIFKDNKPTCVVCFNTEFKSIQVNNTETAKCIHCGRNWDFINREPPFYNANNHIYNCGCKGWV